MALLRDLRVAARISPPTHLFLVGDRRHDDGSGRGDRSLLGFARRAFDAATLREADRVALLCADLQGYEQEPLLTSMVFGAFRDRTDLFDGVAAIVEANAA